MKFEYAYKTSDGVRHVEEMEAPSREVVFETLRAQGIKAIKVVAKDGSKANGEVNVIGVKKRVAFILVLVVAVTTAIVTLTLKEETKSIQAVPMVVTNTVPVHVAISSSAVEIHSRVAKPLPRQVILGDRLRIKNAPTNLFVHAEEYYLSRFAEPGRHVDETMSVNFPTNVVDLFVLLNAPILTSDNEFTEYIDLKRITVGIKQEMRTFIRGGHTAQEYLSELLKRQQLEKSYYEKAEKKLSTLIDEKKMEKKDIYDFWVKANAQLQSMGIYQLPLPDILRDYQMSFDLD